MTAAYGYLFNKLSHLPRNLRFKSVQEFDEAVPDNSYTIGVRDLNGSNGYTTENTLPGWASRILDRINLEGLHEQLFYKESGNLDNVGFFKDGVHREVLTDDLVQRYRFEEIRPMTTNFMSYINYVQSRPYFKKEYYNWKLLNCQDFAGMVRAGLK